MNNLLIAHGGAPTAVINSTLYGIIREAKKHKEIDRILCAVHGSRGILDGHFVDLTDLNHAEEEKLLSAPASAIGTSRLHLEDEDYEAMAKILQEHHISYVLMNGGNGTMDTCGRLGEICKPLGITVVGIPKTIDNDISVIDHSPGFGSAARFVAQAVFDIGQDVSSMPIHVCIIETMGRNAGWLAAASVLARQKEGDAPHLIYLPETPFEIDRFLDDVKECMRKYTHVVVVVSEGICDKDGNSIVPPIFQNHRAVYFGDVSSYLANVIIEKMGVKAHSEKPGILCRCMSLSQSEVDRSEAVEVGAAAVKAVISGENNTMVGIHRISTEPYHCELIQIPISKVMLYEKRMPPEYICESKNDVTKAFADWCRPLVGDINLNSVNFR